MNKTTHHPLIIFFHWLCFGLIIAALLLIEIKNFVPRDNPWRADLKNYHMLLGQIILFVVMLRVVTKLVVINPIEQEKTLARFFKKIIHACLYVFMLGMPITGILLMQSAGKPIPYLGDFYPGMIQESVVLKETFKNIHEYLGNMIYVFIGAHAIMAIWRKYIMKEGAMQQTLLSKVTRSH